MNTIRMVLLAGLVSVVAGCGEGNEGNSEAGPTGAASEQASATGSNAHYGREITGSACELLPPGAVAAVAGVDASVLEQREMAGMCLYAWDGGQASLGLLYVSETAGQARTRFEDAYRSQTGDEVAQAMDQIDDGIEKRASEGTVAVDSQNARQVTGAMRDSFAGGLQFEDVPGVGDLARFETTKIETQFGGSTIVSYANSLNVLSGNLKFTVSFDREGEPKLHLEENAALARAVLDHLPD